MSRKYWPVTTPFKVEDAPRVLRDELRKVAAVIGMLGNFEVSGQYDMSASAAVTLAADDVVTAGLALLVIDGSAVPGSVLVNVNRTGTGNGCYPLAQNYGATSTASASWGIGAIAEPTDGVSARAWIESASADARMVVKLLSGANRTLRVYSLRT